jgi:hypothetical protein
MIGVLPHHIYLRLSLSNNPITMNGVNSINTTNAHPTHSGVGVTGSPLNVGSPIITTTIVPHIINMNELMINLTVLIVDFITLYL